MQTELVIKNESGRIAGKDSYGNDRGRIKGWPQPSHRCPTALAAIDCRNDLAADAV
jgi:hypothetical protein